MLNKVRASTFKDARGFPGWRALSVSDCPDAAETGTYEGSFFFAKSILPFTMEVLVEPTRKISIEKEMG